MIPNRLLSFITSLCFLTCLSSLVFGQYEIKTIGDELSPVKPNFRQTLKDSDGFIWLTSDRGVYRYDGSSIHHFKHKIGDRHTVGDHSCYSVLQDHKKQIWITHSYGLSRYDKAHSSFQNFSPDTSLIPQLGLGFSDIAEDKNGMLWLTGFYDVLVFNPSTKRFQKSGWQHYIKNELKIEEEKRRNATLRIIKKSSDEFWILSVYGLFSVNINSFEYKYFPFNGIEDYFGMSISHQDEHGKLWLSTFNDCFYTYDPKLNIWNHYTCPMGFPSVRKIIPLPNDTLLLMGTNKLYKYLSPKSSFITSDLQIPVDVEELVDVNKIGDDFYILKNKQRPLLHYKKVNYYYNKHSLNLPKGFLNHQSYWIAENQYLIGDWEKKEVLLCGKDGCRILKDEAGNNQLGELQLFYKSSKNEIYFSTSQSIFKISENGVYARSLFKPRAEVLEFRNFVEDNKGSIYVRSRRDGIYVLDENNFIKAGLTPAIKDEFGALFYEKKSNTFWLATEKHGLYVINGKTNAIKSYPNHSLLSGHKGYINDITGDGKGKVFLLITGLGIRIIDSKDMTSNLITLENGLISENLFFGTVTMDGTLWMSSGDGLIVLNSSHNNFYNFSHNAETGRFVGRIYQDEKGNICHNLFPNEILKLNPGVLNEYKPNGRLYIKEILTSGHSLAISDSLFLSYNQNNIALKVGLLDLSSLTQPSFEYNVNDGHWHLVEGGAIHFYEMSPGKYRVNIRLQQDIKIGNTIIITIMPPWWKTWWFYSICFFAITLSIFFIIFSRIQQIKKTENEKSRMKEKVSKMEMQALKAQMNPHFIFNSLNSINRFILINDQDQAIDYLNKFSKLIRNVLDMSNTDTITLEQELETLSLYLKLESMRFQDNFTWEIIVPETINTETIYLPPILIQPYVENAIWHGFAQAPLSQKVKKLIIDISQSDETLIIKIDDNGIGRVEASNIKEQNGSLHKSYGTLLNAERLNLLNLTNNIKANVEVQDKYDGDKPSGTLVIIKLKY